MAALNPFTPGASTTASVTSSSAAVALPAGSGSVIRLCNVGSVECFFALGGSSVSAASDGTSASLPPGTIELFSIDNSTMTNIAFKTASSTTTVRVTRGDGG